MGGGGGQGGGERGGGAFSPSADADSMFRPLDPDAGVEGSGVAGSISVLNQQGRDADGEGTHQSPSSSPSSRLPVTGWGRQAFPQASGLHNLNSLDDWHAGMIGGGMSSMFDGMPDVIEDGVTVTVHVCLADAEGHPDLATVQTRTAMSGTMTLATLCRQELKAAGREGEDLRPTTALARIWTSCPQIRKMENFFRQDDHEKKIPPDHVRAGAMLVLLELPTPPAKGRSGDGACWPRDTGEWSCLTCTYKNKFNHYGNYTCEMCRRHTGPNEHGQVLARASELCPELGIDLETALVAGKNAVGTRKTESNNMTMPVNPTQSGSTSSMDGHGGSTGGTGENSLRVQTRSELYQEPSVLPPSTTAAQRPPTPPTPPPPPATDLLAATDTTTAGTPSTSATSGVRPVVQDPNVEQLIAISCKSYKTCAHVLKQCNGNIEMAAMKFFDPGFIDPFPDEGKDDNDAAADEDDVASQATVES